MAFNDTVMDHVLNPRNSGPLPDATCVGCVGIPGEGRYIKVYLVVVDERIEEASYECNGCPASIASASLVCQLARGRTTDFAGLIEPKDVLVLLHGLPEGKEEMAQMAVEALRNALRPTD
jgi:NifU-like protein involved in Fe-S cluster formation